ncbi:globin domain-containing protein [Mangrovibacterium lignilyticum]|uniref:globin domain-containing protein n=1 Tax=Mangrovibacterium lignilyticum TaxID=2668052 RepID=UPI0013D0983C|nr:globin [Mangrovibacterium lignilyticum]
MDFKITPMPFGLRLNKYQPDNELYTILGEEGIRQMVSDHYDLLAASKIKHLFPDDEKGLEGAKQRSADFFIQRLGGPDYFNQRRGSPQLASRHLPFRINAEARMIWLQSYAKVLGKLENVPEPVIEAFWNYIHDFSNWMVNTPDRPSILFAKK